MKQLMLVALAALLTACSSRPAWVTTLEEHDGRITRRYDVRHYLADHFFTLQQGLSSGLSGPSEQSEREAELFDRVREIQSDEILAVLVFHTAKYPTGKIYYDKMEAVRDTRYLPIEEEQPGVFILVGTEQEHAKVLMWLKNLRPEYVNWAKVVPDIPSEILDPPAPRRETPPINAN